MKEEGREGEMEGGKGRWRGRKGDGGGREGGKGRWRGEGRREREIEGGREEGNKVKGRCLP